jgi:arginine decarboxylase
VGEIAAESLAVYPPGIPNVLPGEQFTERVVAHLLRAAGDGAFVRGASDRSLQTVKVVAPQAVSP